MRVLVVEDDEDLARQLKDCLAQAGYSVDLAADGEEGHYLGANEPYDAVVLDLGLPVIDGITVLERWRQEGHAMPVLILTARPSMVTRAALVSIRSAPQSITAEAWPAERRISARTRASTSSMRNGLVT